MEVKSSKTPFVAGFVGKNNIFEYQSKTIAVRPENLLVSQEKPDAFNRIQATVSHTIFQGTHYFAHFESEYGHMMAQVPADMILSDGQPGSCGHREHGEAEKGAGVHHF